LPPGLTLSSAGTLSGTPTQSGTFDTVVIKLTDSLSRTVQWTYTITIP
jgi:Putative Ig domain